MCPGLQNHTHPAPSVTRITTRKAFVMTAADRTARAGTGARQRGASPSLQVRVLAGVAGGLSGGIVFGVLMALMGMLPMIASLVGSSSAALGFLVHLVISVLIGLALTVPFARLLTGSLGRSALVGAVYGALWWVLGPLLIMPAMMGMPLLALNGASALSLMGHVMYGLILGLVATIVLRRR